MFNSIIYFAVGLIGKSGYVGLFLLSALESAAIPIPSEVVLPFSGFLAFSGRFGLWEVVFVSSVANLVGSLVLYFIGRSGGRWILERYGRLVLISQEDLDSWDRWFEKHGSRTVFWSRLLPIVRTFVSLPAGIAGMSVMKFSTYTLLGALPWNFMLAFIGFKAGQNWNILRPYFQKADIFIGAVAILALIWYFVRHRRHKR